jgi:hypothetical protein
MIGLSIQVVRRRMKAGVSLGDGDDKTLRQAIRAHANAAEHIPLILIGLGALEALGAATAALLGYGGVLVVARGMHAIGLGRANTVNPLRQFGVVLTWLVMLIQAIHLLVVATPAINL